MLSKMPKNNFPRIFAHFPFITFSWGRLDFFPRMLRASLFSFPEREREREKCCAHIAYFETGKKINSEFFLLAKDIHEKIREKGKVRERNEGERGREGGRERETNEKEKKEKKNVVFI